MAAPGRTIPQEMDWTKSTEAGVVASIRRWGRQTDADRHTVAVMNTLSWADDAAADGDLEGALAWLEAVEAIGDVLPTPYPARRAAWKAALVSRAV